MSIIVTNRVEPLVGEDGLPTLRFAELLEDLVNTVNALLAPAVNIQDGDYTFILTDAANIVRKTSAITSRKYTIPSNASVAFDIGTSIEVQNDGSVAMKVTIDADTLTFEADGTTGERTIASKGSGRFLKIAATEWKCHGEQMT